MTSKRPLPDPDDPLTASFWSGTKESKLLVQSCDGCGYLRWPPSLICPECLRPGGVWAPVRPAGTLWSFAIYRRALAAGFRDEVPYAVGSIELDDGPRMIGTLVGDVTQFIVGERMRAVFRAFDDVALVEWEKGGHDGAE